MTRQKDQGIGSGEDGPVEIIISLQDDVYEMVKSGVKTIEFRRRWSLPPVTAYVYKSGKTRELSAWIELGEATRGTASEMEAIAEKMKTGYGPGIKKYLTSSNGGYAIPIKRFVEFPPIGLAQMRELGVQPPQFFTFLRNHPRLKKQLEKNLKDAYRDSSE